jgi:signal transduction histidine kinase
LIDVSLRLNESALEALKDQRSHLIDQIETIFRRNLFSSRAFIRPADLERLASAEADAFLQYLNTSNEIGAEANGAELARSGLGEGAVLSLGGVFRAILIPLFPDQDLRSIDCYIEGYHSAVVQGFLKAREANILEEQEHIRSALQQTLHRYNLQIQTASEVAKAAISTLDLGELLTTAVDVIGERFGLDYVGIYLLDSSKQHAVLRAATGHEGRKRLAAQHRLKVGGQSTVGRALNARRHLMISETGGAVTAMETSWLEETRSELVLPLISRGDVIGALTVQSNDSGAFSSQDVPGLQIMADQLANAIKNARLYADARQRADELALAYTELKQLDQLKDEFMQNVSHELRTPLTMISGYADMLNAGQLGELNVEQQDVVRVIQRYAQALAELVSDIIAVLEIRARRSTTTTVSLRDAVRMTLANFRLLAEEKQVEIELDIPEFPEPLSVGVESDHLRRVMDNLLSNAIKFTPSGGKILVRVWRNEQQAFVEIIDTGIGIPVGVQDRIFDRFYQVDSSIRRRFGGTGLGLSVVKDLIESYGGSVSVASPGEDAGSTFTVALPISLE